jgi:hypothetical protein
MKNLIKKYRDFRMSLIVKFAQSYADTIAYALENSRNENELDFWYNKGAWLNAWMIINYNVYLD